MKITTNPADPYWSFIDHETVRKHYKGKHPDPDKFKKILAQEMAKDEANHNNEEYRKGRIR